MPVEIAYLVHDLADPSVHRRVKMLEMGGARVRLAGFRRTATPPATLGIPFVDLGHTQDAALASRAASVAKAMIGAGSLEKTFRGADVVLARNLEMLAIASRARERFAPKASFVYECLDIHRLLLSPAPAGRLLRALEARLLRQVDCIVTSSPAFVRNYFSTRGISTSIEIVENKVIERDIHADVLRRPVASAPWKIGYFGMLRCRKSIEILASLARSQNGRVEVVIRGKPSPAIFPDFEAELKHMPYVSFHGPYKGASELARIYGEVHFAWAIDYYEASQNSNWLLPNRIYESAYLGAVPIALSEVETGRWLASHRAGVLVADPSADLTRFFAGMGKATYETLAQQIANIPRSKLACSAEDCLHLVSLLHGVRQAQGAERITSTMNLN